MDWNGGELYSHWDHGARATLPETRSRRPWCRIIRYLGEGHADSRLPAGSEELVAAASAAPLAIDGVERQDGRSARHAGPFGHRAIDVQPRRSVHRGRRLSRENVLSHRLEERGRAPESIPGERPTMALPMVGAHPTGPGWRSPLRAARWRGDPSPVSHGTRRRRGCSSTFPGRGELPTDVCSRPTVNRS